MVGCVPPDYSHKEDGPPMVAIISGVVAVVVILTGVGVFLRVNPSYCTTAKLGPVEKLSTEESPEADHSQMQMVTSGQGGEGGTGGV